MSGFSAQELSMLAVSLARLEYRPSDTWLDAFAAAAAARMHNFQAQVSRGVRGPSAAGAAAAAGAVAAAFCFHKC